MKIKEKTNLSYSVKILIFLGLCVLIFRCTVVTPLVIGENNFEPTSFNSFVEPDFPFVSTYVDARKLGRTFPNDNIVSRGLIINLGDSAFVCFDRDLLRWSVAWTGKHLTESMLPQVSNSQFFNRAAHIPLVAGKPVIGNGIYPGWSSGKLDLKDVRPATQKTAGLTWGPLPPAYGHYNGSYVYGSQLILSYTSSNTEILELPGVIRQSGETIFTRTLEIGNSTDSLFMNVAELRGGTKSINEGSVGYIYFGEKRDSVIAVGINENSSHRNASVRLTADRYLSVTVSPSDKERKMAVFLWRGATKDLNRFKEIVNSTHFKIPSFKKGAKSRWPGEIITKGKIAPDTATFVTDQLTLPIPNPYKRNVRVTDLAFLNKTTAVVSTFEGDLWIVKGIDDKLEKM